MVTVDEVKAFLATPEAAPLLTELKTLDANTVKGWLETNEEGKSYLNSYADSKVTKGIETFKTKTLPTLVEEEVTKRNPKETEEQKALRQLKSEFDNLKKEASRKELLNSALTYATEKGIPAKYIDRFIGDDSESTIANIDAFGTYFKDAVQQAVTGTFKDGGRTVTADSDKKGTITVADMSTMTRAELLKHQNSIKF